MYDLDAYSLVTPLPEGLAPASDAGALATGVLVGLDPVKGQAQVTVSGSAPIWVPALPGIYTANGLVRLTRSPLDGGRITKCEGPLTAGQIVASGRVTAVNSGVGLLTVSTLGGTYALPYAPGTYAVGTLVHVLRSEAKYGLPYFVPGPSGSYNADNPGLPGGGSGNPGELVDRQAIILPQWTGSWRASQGRWDTWNTDRYGGRSTLWQGNGFGSGSMAGLAAYGDQLVNLGAQAITRMLVSVYRADTSSSTGKVAVLQPSPHGGQPAGAPSVSGANASTPALTPNQGVQIDLPSSVFEAFRTGASRGLVTVGADYAGFSGTPDRSPVHADGMALTVQYKVIA